MTIRELIARVKSSYNGGVGSDDSRLRARLVYSKIKTAYADLLNDVRIRVRASDFTRTTIDCVQLEETTPYDCECIPPLGCKVYRSKYKIPKPLFNLGRLQFGPVKTIDGLKEYSILTSQEVTYSSKSKYAHSIEAAFIKNEYLYVVKNPDGVEVVSITLIPEDPFAVAEFKNMCADCNPVTECVSILDTKFNIDPEIVDKVIEKATADTIKYYFGVPKDRANDGAEETNKT